MGRISFEGKVLYGNESCKEELSKLKFREGNNAPKIFRDFLENMINNKEFYLKILEINTGSKVFEFVISPIEDNKYVNIYGRDITERKDAQLEINNAYTKLQKTSR